MTKQGIRLRLQPARHTLALKGRLPDLCARVAAGGLRPAPLSFTPAVEAPVEGASLLIGTDPTFLAVLR